MSLQGSIEDFALPDVLVLLSSTKKDGELRVKGGRIEGQVWLESGQIVHSAIFEKPTPPVDAVFELLRLATGTFSFAGEAKPPKRSQPQLIDTVLADAQIRLAEWKEIAKVVPHLDAVVDMAAEAPSDDVKVSRDQWKLLRTVAGGRSVHDLMTALGRNEFDTCKKVKELVDAKLASLDVSAKPKSAAPTSTAAPSPAGAAPAVSGPAPSDSGAGTRPTSEPVRTPSAPRETLPVAIDPATGPTTPRVAAKLAGEPPKSFGEDRDGPPQPGPAPANGPVPVTAAEALAAATAELAGRSKVRAVNVADDRPALPGSRPVATKPGGADPATAPPEPAKDPAEEAKALVAQLAAIGGEDEEEVAQKVAEHLASGGELPEVPAGDEPINRGLLLKFLSSVRN